MWPTDENWRKRQYGSPSAPVSTTDLPPPARRSAHAACTTPGQDHRRHWVTGQVGEPVALALAKENEVVGAARFRDQAARRRLEAAGSDACRSTWPRATWPASRQGPTMSELRRGKSNNWELDLRTNGGGLAWLMEHHQEAAAFVHCSTTGVYKPMAITCSPNRTSSGQPRRLAVPPHVQHLQDRRRGHRPMGVGALRPPHHSCPPVRPLWRPGRVAAIHLEMMINGSEIPVHLDAPSVYHPLHEDDIIAMIPADRRRRHPGHHGELGGDQAASIEEWCGYLSELTGVPARFAPTRDTIDSVQIDLTRMHQLVGTTTVGWRDGMRRMVAAVTRSSCPTRRSASYGAVTAGARQVGHVAHRPCGHRR